MRGSPATIKSITANHESVLDPTMVTSHTVTLKWQGLPGTASSMSVTPTFTTQAFTVDNAKNIYSIEYMSRDQQFFYYKVTFTDYTDYEMKIPRVVQSQQMIVVSELPDVATARQDAIYLLQEDPVRQVYTKWIKVLNQAGTAFTWLSLGSTELDLSDYQRKIDQNIIKTYKNYDPSTKDLKPTAKNLVGAVNTFQKALGATYDDAQQKVTSLDTLHKSTLVEAINEIGYIPDLQVYDTLTGTPDNLVDAINLANTDFILSKSATIDRTKNVSEYQFKKDAKDGSAIAQVGDTIQIPRVDLTQRNTPATNDYRTYDLTLASEKYDQNDTSRKPYGTVHIPIIKLAKIQPVTDASLSAQYYLSIDGATAYDPAVAGSKIQISKDMVIKDAGVKQCVQTGIPLANLVIGDKYIYMQFELADGTFKYAYIAVKDMLTPYDGVNAISIDFDSVQQTNIVSLVIHDPTAHSALVQTSQGLRAMDATQTQYGVVQFATATQVKSPSDSNAKVVKPYDLYSFVTASESVQDDLGNIYEKDDGTKPNNTITKAISQLSTINVQKKADAIVDAKNMAQYIVRTLPEVGTTNKLGQTIEIPRTLLQVQKLSTLADPKEYLLYYLTKMDGTMRPGLYKNYDNKWEKISGGAIEYVDELPTDPQEDHFYAIQNKDEVTFRFKLTQTALSSGYTMHDDGLHHGTTVITWANVYDNWLSYKDTILTEYSNGQLFYITYEDGTTGFVYAYDNYDVRLWFYKGEWIRMFEPERIPIATIDSLNIQD